MILQFVKILQNKIALKDKSGPLVTCSNKIANNLTNYFCTNYLIMEEGIDKCFNMLVLLVV